MSLTIPIPATFLPHPPDKSVGETVTFKSKRLSTDIEEEVRIEVSQELDIEPKDIYKYLAVELGQTIEEGTVLAQKKGFMSRQAARAPRSGEVRKIDHTTGTVTLVATGSQNHTFEISGTYKGMKEGDVLISVTNGIAVPLSMAISRSFSGTCAYCATPDDIDEQRCEGHVVIAPSLSSIDLSKVCAFSPIAIITNKLVYYSNDIPQLQVSEPETFNKIMEKRYTSALYIGSSRHAYVFTPEGENNEQS